MKIFKPIYQKELNKALKTLVVPALKAQGFRYEGVQDISTELLPNWFEGCFINKTTNRCIEISYRPTSDRGRESLKCHISQLKVEVDEFDYTSANRMSVPSQDISDIDGALSQKFAELLPRLVTELENNFKPVIQGKHFETEPIDWMGLK
jgi:hypothetical protein